ncbi:uncharacterized protein [Linepithema humile]
MTEDTIWFCENTNPGNLLAYNRTEDGTIKKDNKIVGTNYTFIKSIAYCDDYILSGDVDGMIKRWKIKNNKNDFECLKIHNVDKPIRLIDATSQHIITSLQSSFANSIKILKYTDDKKGCTEVNEIFYADNYLASYVSSISFDPIGTKFAASSNKTGSSSSFLIYDIDKSYQIMDKKCGDHCFQLLWEDSHTILMCFVNSIKKMDMRTSEVVRTWDSSKYGRSLCCSSDNRYTFMTGNYNAALWDQRQSVAIQTYFVEDDKYKAVFALEFDNTQMYAVTVNGLYELDFTGRDHFDHKEIKKYFDNF